MFYRLRELGLVSSHSNGMSNWPYEYFPVNLPSFGNFRHPLLISEPRQTHLATVNVENLKLNFGMKLNPQNLHMAVFLQFFTLLYD